MDKIHADEDLDKENFQYLLGLLFADVGEYKYVKNCDSRHIRQLQLVTIGYLFRLFKAPFLTSCHIFLLNYVIRSDNYEF